LGGLTEPAVWSADVEIDVAAALSMPGPVMMRGWIKGPGEPGAGAPLV
jgi:hypothetical protein